MKPLYDTQKCPPVRISSTRRADSATMAASLEPSRPLAARQTTMGEL